MNQPSSAQRKFARGVSLIKSLQSEVAAFEAGHAYEFQAEVELQKPREIRYRCSATEITAPSPEWPLIAGDAIQNLRASLDHLIWAATPEDCRGVRTSFPITTDPGTFERAAKQAVKGVPAELHKSVEKAQPYITTPAAPKRALLEQLRELSNLDKHRTLTTIVGAVNMEAVGLPDGANATWQKHATRRPLGSGTTHISTFTVTADTDLADTVVEPVFRYALLLEGHSLSRLTSIAQDVYRVLMECEQGVPLSPFAQYPL